MILHVASAQEDVSSRVRRQRKCIQHQPQARPLSCRQPYSYQQQHRRRQWIGFAYWILLVRLEMGVVLPHRRFTRTMLVVVVSSILSRHYHTLEATSSSSSSSSPPHPPHHRTSRSTTSSQPTTRTSSSSVHKKKSRVMSQDHKTPVLLSSCSTPALSSSSCMSASSGSCTIRMPTRDDPELQLLASEISSSSNSVCSARISSSDDNMSSSASRIFKGHMEYSFGPAPSIEGEKNSNDSDDSSSHRNTDHATPRHTERNSTTRIMKNEKEATIKFRAGEDTTNNKVVPIKKGQTALLTKSKPETITITSSRRGVISTSESIQRRNRIQSSDTLRRIQSEWKEAVLAGVAFDWRTGQPVIMRAKQTDDSDNKRALESNIDNSNSFSSRPIASSHIWLGPLTGRRPSSTRGLYVWHFTMTGVKGSVYENGVYHGRIVLPSNYPAGPPRIQLWTPSGRFIPFMDICLLTASPYHPEAWTPSQWSLRTLIEALRLHMCTPAHEIGGIQSSYEQRQQFALSSQYWRCGIPATISTTSGVTTASSSSSSSSSGATNKHTGRGHGVIVIDHSIMIQRGYLMINDHDGEK